MQHSDPFKDTHARYMLSHKCREAFEWDTWIPLIPCINFPRHWRVKIIPPTAAAMIRFRVVSDDDKDFISVYLDCHGQLGGMPDTPYWEAYPLGEHETERFHLKEVDEMIEAISREVEARGFYG